jgi:diacylglycerol kinase (ATP)
LTSAASTGAPVLATGAAILLVNPSAGKGRGARYARAAERALRDLGVAVRTVAGRDAAEAVGLATAALAQSVGPLVVVGGDGMVNLALQLVAGTERPLAVIPAGTGNDIARYLGMPLRDPEAAARVVAAGRTARFDLGRVSTPAAPGPRWFGTVLACGLDSAVNDRANRMRRPRGSSRYTLALLAELPRFTPIPFAVTVGDRRGEFDGMLIAVGNGPGYGGGMLICPQADLHDGRFQVTSVHKVAKGTLLRIFPKVFGGRHIGHPAVEVSHGERVLIESAADRPVSVWADGELMGTLPARCETVRGALVAIVGDPAS